MYIFGGQVSRNASAKYSNTMRATFNVKLRVKWQDIENIHNIMAEFHEYNQFDPLFQPSIQFDLHFFDTVVFLKKITLTLTRTEKKLSSRDANIL
jgi:hypothetical protein